jgi:hypothetical protein
VKQHDSDSLYPVCLFSYICLYVVMVRIQKYFLCCTGVHSVFNSLVPMNFVIFIMKLGNESVLLYQRLCAFLLL